jgi:hypothetical protein
MDATAIIINISVRNFPDPQDGAHFCMRISHKAKDAAHSRE